MAKKKSKKGKMPKRLAGVKLPKQVRRGLEDLFASKQGRKLVAETVLAAGAALVGTQARKRSTTRSFLREHGSNAPQDVPGAVASSASALSFALGEASRSFIDALHRGKAMADARAAWPEVKEEDEPAPAKKKPGSAPETTPAH